MSEQLSAIETDTARRFGRFVSGHAEEALLWLPVNNSRETAPDGTREITGGSAEELVLAAVRRVEFEITHKPWMPDADASDVPFFDMNVIFSLSEAEQERYDLSEETEISVELVPGSGWDIEDPADRLPLIDEDYDADDPYRNIKALGKVLDMLERQESAGLLMAAHKRRFPLEAID